MKWYYAEDGQQRGPVAEAELQELHRSGKINGDSLVWREGQAKWQPYREVIVEGGGAGAPPVVGAPADGVVCNECGGIFPRDEVISLGGATVCAACKPRQLQRMREGASNPGAIEYAGFGIRFGAKFLDGLIGRFLGFLIGMGVAQAHMSGNAALAVAYGSGILVEVLYRTIFVGAYGATPGKMACKIVIVNADGTPVSYAKALARALAEYLSLIIVFIGYIMAGFDSQKRALHDRICGTRVIKK